LVVPVAGAVFFGAIFVLSASLAFWWVDSGQLGHSFTYGGRDFSTFPVGIYGSVFRRIFAYGFGLGFAGYYPALLVLGRADPLGAPDWFGWLTPAVGLLACLVAALLWRTGIRRYRSTGS